MGKILSMEAIPFVLAFERETPEGEKTVWHIRPLKWKERAEVQDGMVVTEINVTGPKNQANKGVMKHLGGTQARIAIEKGLVRVENLRDRSNQLVKFDDSLTPEAKERVLDMIPPEWTKEIADEILKLSGLMKEEEKN